MRVIRLALGSIAFWGLFVNAALAQTPQMKKPPPQTTIDVTFDGGTLEAYVARIRQLVPGVGIVIDGDLGSVEVPKAPLPNVSIPQALQWITQTDDARRRGVVLQTTRGSGEALPVFLYTAGPSSAPRVPPPEDHQVKAYFVQTLDDIEPPVEPESVRMAVETALQKQDSKVKGSAEYNPETRMLTVSGTRSDIFLADQVIEAMTQGRRVGAALPRLQAEVDRLTSRVATLEAQLASLKKVEPGLPRR